MDEELTIDTLYLKDTSKPEGEACNLDGTLKDASQIEWVNSPSDVVPPSFKNHDEHTLDDKSEDDHITKKHRVR